MSMLPHIVTERSMFGNTVLVALFCHTNKEPDSGLHCVCCWILNSSVFVEHPATGMGIV